MYGFDEKAEHNILVYDLEGGTFEALRLTIDNGVEVVAANGDPHWGGEGFDPRVRQHFIEVESRSRPPTATRTWVARVRPVRKAGECRVEVAAANGDPRLGGEGFDQRVKRHFMKVESRSRPPTATRTWVARVSTST
jgi:molecular chaperone DnaK (HSP70)